MEYFPWQSFLKTASGLWYQLAQLSGESPFTSFASRRNRMALTSP